MSQWRPQTDLERLLDALAAELMAASDDDVRRASGPRGIAAAADEVRRVIDGVLGDPAEADAPRGVDAGLPPVAFLREHRARQH
ncbi:MAG TPA: hypothetical protein VKX28_23590 [Xanthobacteraceae bacterium]|nr:hypothetical protein [Xanthobacteraceae bacterium]